MIFPLDNRHFITDLWLDEGRVYKKTKDSLEVLGSHKQMSLDDISDINP